MDPVVCSCNLISAACLQIKFIPHFRRCARHDDWGDFTEKSSGLFGNSNPTSFTVWGALVVLPSRRRGAADRQAGKECFVSPLLR